MASNRIGRINEEIQRSSPPSSVPSRIPGSTAWFHHRGGHHARPVVRQDLRQRTGQERREERWSGLRSAGGYLRRELGAASQLGTPPELTFVADDSHRRGRAHILELIEKLDQ